MTILAAEERYLIEVTNKTRMENGLQPLATNERLDRSADQHNAWLLDTGEFSHKGEGGTSSHQRIKAEGYTFPGGGMTGENIAWASLRGLPGLQDDIDFMHQAWMDSPGHRANILHEDFAEIGIGLETGYYDRFVYGPSLMGTQNFAVAYAKDAFLTGVAITDEDGDSFYDLGEGLGGIRVEAVNADGDMFATLTDDAGGYNLSLGSGRYDVTFSGEGFQSFTQAVWMGGENEKLDMLAEKASDPEPEVTPEPEPEVDSEPDYGGGDDATNGDDSNGNGDGTVQTVTLTLAANIAGGPASATLLVDGTEAGTVLVGNRTWREGFQDYEIDVDTTLLEGAKTLAVRFDNPAPGRGLHTDAITIGDERIDITSGKGGGYLTAYNSRTFAEVSIEGMFVDLDTPTNDPTEPSDDTPADWDWDDDGSPALVVSLAGNQANGAPIAIVSVDGRDVAAFEVPNTTWREGIQDFAIDIDPALLEGDGHMVEVRFANPAPGRGLVMDAITVRGVRYEAEESGPTDGFLTAYNARTVASIVTGEEGRTVVMGSDTDDELTGTSEADWIHAGLGDDAIEGGDGADVFVFGFDRGSRDVVMDYEAGLDTVALEDGLALQSIVSAGDNALVTLAKWGMTQTVVFEDTDWQTLADDLLVI